MVSTNSRSAADDVFPPRNLPPLADPWGRAHDNRVRQLERTMETLQQLLQGQNRNSAATSATIGEQLGTLFNQIEDLRGRVSYSETDPALSQTWTSSQPDNEPWGPSLTFTLDMPRVVSVEFSVSGLANGGAWNKQTTTTVRALGAVFVNDEIAQGPAGQVYVNLESNPEERDFRTGQAQNLISASALVSLPAGTHTVRGGFAFRHVWVFSGPVTAEGYGVIVVSNPTISVNVLQPVENPELVD